MIKKFILISVTCLFCISCGVKGDPEYKSKNNFIKKINLV